MFANFILVAFAALAIAMPAAEPGPAAAAVSPDPSQVYLNAITYGGTGCPQGSIGSFISADRQTFTLIFDSYVASIGPGVAITETRKNCQLNLDLRYPGGFQYSVFSTIYRGYVGLDKGVTATQSATYYFSGQTSQSTTSASFSGPVSKDYEIESDLTLSSVVWSPCGSPVALNVDSAVLLRSSASSATGQITDDSIDGKITFVVDLQWQKC